MGRDSKASAPPLIPVEPIQRAIGEEVMLDADLAALCGVTTANLNKSVKRNRERFPEEFMFQLTAEEAENLRFQFGMSSSPGGRRYLPYAYIVQGVAMPSKENPIPCWIKRRTHASKTPNALAPFPNVPRRPDN